MCMRCVKVYVRPVFACVLVFGLPRHSPTPHPHQQSTAQTQTNLPGRIPELELDAIAGVGLVIFNFHVLEPKVNADCRDKVVGKAVVAVPEKQV